MIFLALKRRKFIRIVSYLVAVSVVFAASGLISQRARAGYEETLGKVRLSNLTSLCEYTREIGSGLRVLAVSSGDSTADSMAFVRDRIMGAVGCINAFESKSTKHMSKFFGKVYTFAENFTGTEKERETAVRLAVYAQEIYYHLNDVSSAVLNGAYALTEYQGVYKKTDKPYFEKFLDYTNGKEKELFKLVSPVSAQVGKYVLLSGKEKISEDTAREIAGEIVGINPTLWRTGEDTQAEIALHSLRHGDAAVDICENGGMIYRIINPSGCKKAFYGISQAEDFAKEFLESNGFSDMVCTEKELGEFEADFVFAPSVSGVLLLNASVRATVCLSDGKVTHFEAADYIRNYSQEVSSSGVAAVVLPPNLDVRETLKCVAEINGRERNCILALSDFEGDEVLTFVDAESGRVLKTEIR